MAGGSEREIQIAVRIRPGPEPVVDVDPADGKVLVSAAGQERFGYPSRVVKGSDQGAAFEALASVLLARAREGFNCTLLAYGQTGSGKTHTMFGPPGSLTEAAVQQQQRAGAARQAPASWGLFPRAVLALLQQGDEGVQVPLHASAVEVYQEGVFDLLDDRAPLAIGSSKPLGTRVSGRADLGGNNQRAVNGVHPACCTCKTCFLAQEEAKQAQEAVRRARAEQATAAARASSSRGRTAAARTSASPTKAASSSVESFATVGETLVPLRTPEDVARFARTVEATRTAKSHLLNDRSSRSHCLVKVHVKRRPAPAPTGGTGGGAAAGIRVASLLFVDLAGSERLQRTGAEGAAQAEATSINSSLSALGRVVRALGAQGAGKSGAPHVPYRDAALTMLLRDSFGGKSCTSVVINVAGEAEHAEESVCSLRFGERMAVVRNAPTLVVDSDAGGDADHLHFLLAAARRELEEMTAAGQGGGFVPGAPNSERLSLAENMRKLAESEREVRECIVQLAEARSRGGAQAEVSALQQRLRSSGAQAEVFQGIVERQQTIKSLWALPTPAFRRKAAEVKELEGRVTLALGS